MRNFLEYCPNSASDLHKLVFSWLRTGICLIKLPLQWWCLPTNDPWPLPFHNTCCVLRPFDWWWYGMVPIRLINHILRSNQKQKQTLEDVGTVVWMTTKATTYLDTGSQHEWDTVPGDVWVNPIHSHHLLWSWEGNKSWVFTEWILIISSCRFKALSLLGASARPSSPGSRLALLLVYVALLLSSQYI